MRGVLIASIVAGCGFQTQSTPLVPDGRNPGDGMRDTSGIPRVKTGLVAYWTFDDPSSSAAAADTSGTAAPVPLSVITSAQIAAPTFDGDRITADIPARMLSAVGSHLAADCAAAGAVSLEVWLSPAMPNQGTAIEPRFVTGLAGSVTLRDIVLLQADDKWLARARTTIDLNGGPDLVSSTTIGSTAMTHIVVVADAQQRVLYVDDHVAATTAAAPPLAWDVTYPAALFDEPQHGRPWLGTVALVALYAHGLTADEVHQNFTAGPAAP